MNRYKYHYNAAVGCLNRCGYHIVGGMLKKCALVAWDPKTDALVFIKVRRHAKLSYRNRLRYESKAKRLEFRKACAAWRRVNKWRGAWRIDIIDVYCDGVHRPYADHIMSVKGYNNDKK